MNILLFLYVMANQQHVGETSRSVGDYWLPEVWIFSPAPAWASSLAKVLQSVSPFEAYALKERDPSEIGAELSRRGLVEEDPTFIFRFNSRGNVIGDCLDIVRTWRGRKHWQGAFIAVVCEGQYCDSILNSDLWGSASRRNQFREVPGHQCVTEPVNVPYLIELLLKSKSCDYHEWRERMVSSELWKIQQLAKSLGTGLGVELNSEVHDELLYVCRAFREVGWTSIKAVIPHRVERGLEQLLSTPIPKETERLISEIQTIDAILQDVLLGDSPPEDTL